ncbi:sugar transporter domain-containing protein [Trichoderma breve]|uniref:Sugar transporter domain-containing protein n=1 Tax=Trichoderma breve TaxID=2034170 RepID=A0A9W9EA75_9HYPO|nr:sugar transporter domain-containing protein [Trichoderma breve]KAJ4862101.1 sugar transporter domain-containing protein [Trichoderma breve]
MKESTNVTNILFMTAFSGLLIGFNLASMTGILDVMKFSSDPTVPFQREMLASMIPFGSIMGALVTWLIVDQFGAPKTLGWATLVWAIGSGLMANSGRLTLLSIGRGIAGVGGRMLSAIVPAYMVEIAPKESRGSYMSLGILLINGIQFMATRLLGDKFSGSDPLNDPRPVVYALRISYLLQAIPGLAFLLFTMFLPNSPYHLAYKGHWREAHELMAALENRRTTDSKVLAHYEQMRQEIQARRADGQPQLRMLFHPSERYKLILGMFTQLWNQLCGIHVFLYHTTWTIGSAGVAWFHLAVFFIYLFNILSTAMSGSTLPDGVGRRPTLMAGSIVIISCLMTMGVVQVAFTKLNLGDLEGTYFDDIPYVIQNPGASNAVMVLASLFIVTYAATWGPTSWTYSTEILPPYLRSRGVALCTVSYWVGNLIMSLAVPRMLMRFDAKIYYLFALFNFFAFSHVAAEARETEGGPLEEMDDLFNSGRFAWEKQPRGVKFDFLVSRFENHPAVVDNTAAGPEQDSIELESMDGNTIGNTITNTITNGAAV